MRWKLLQKSPIKICMSLKVRLPFITSDSLKQPIRRLVDSFPFNLRPIMPYFSHLQHFSSSFSIHTYLCVHKSSYIFPIEQCYIYRFKFCLSFSILTLLFDLKSALPRFLQKCFSDLITKKQRLISAQRLETSEALLPISCAAFISRIKFPNPAVQVFVPIQQLLIFAAQPLGHMLESELQHFHFCRLVSLQSCYSPVDNITCSSFRYLIMRRGESWIKLYTQSEEAQTPWRERMPLKCVKGCVWPSDHLPSTDVWLLAVDLSSRRILWEISTLHFLLINCSESSNLVGRGVIHWERAIRVRKSIISTRIFAPTSGEDVVIIQ